MTGAISRAWAPSSDCGRPSTAWTSQAMPPVSRRPATTTYRAPTVTMPSFDRPASASLGRQDADQHQERDAADEHDVGRRPG